MFIETEATPNPATLKFLPGRPVLPQGTLDIRDSEGAGQSPLAQALFSIDGVSGVFFGSDFISVTKSGGDWPNLKPVVLGAIMEHFVSGEPLLIGEFNGAAQGDGGEFFAGDDAETVVTIKKLIETHVRPAVANDGGDIKFRGYRDGTVYLALRGRVPAVPRRPRRSGKGSRICSSIMSPMCARSNKSNSGPGPFPAFDRSSGKF